jgi:hypothetical protein
MQVRRQLCRGKDSRAQRFIQRRWGNRCLLHIGPGQSMSDRQESSGVPVPRGHRSTEGCLKCKDRGVLDLGDEKRSEILFALNPEGETSIAANAQILPVQGR